MQRNFPQHKGPVVGENLAHIPPEEVSGPEAIIDEGPSFAHHLVRCHTQPRSQKLGPTGTGKSPSAIRYPSSSTPMGSIGNGRAAGPKMTFAPSVARNVDWWHGQRMR